MKFIFRKFGIAILTDYCSFIFKIICINIKTFATLASKFNFHHHYHLPFKVIILQINTKPLEDNGIRR
ncbi:Hypothetical protein CKL_1943 [Clostridium kluyveri DSM 555]|uniref:Uncharacterized protein n=1 Tax=Clostridium kluyveri (strain ATCC 8527 / DSM 555 / NBRC 12016 / NCIMB 10680 / K1) TaxID=431943 RepID=A5MYK9_CLOK5|nr:Hypothetical protein CKL_1843 [Clostridium kluyveri DSM 555]EDK33955.1 Hypothetical protein CKL_1943 [Clostridium kluyveri DSM 555]